MAKTPRKSREDLEAIGDPDYIPRNEFERDKIDGALKPLDAVASDMESRWGIGRLQELCTTSTSAKFQSAKHKLDLAIMQGSAAEVIERARILILGWKAMEKEAKEAGNNPAPPDVWFASAPEEDGKPAVQYAIAKNNSDASLAEAGMSVYTLVEVARIIRAFNAPMQKHIEKAKETFPKAEIIRAEGEFNDEIPF